MLMFFHILCSEAQLCDALGSETRLCLLSHIQILFSFELESSGIKQLCLSQLPSHKLKFGWVFYEQEQAKDAKSRY